MAATHEVLRYTLNFLEELGRGAFGTVYTGSKADDGSAAAIKKVSTVTKEDKRKAVTEAFRFHYLKNEIIQRNEHILKIHDMKYYQCAVWIVMEYCHLGDLNNYFKIQVNLMKETNHKLEAMKQIINGVVLLHSKNIVHRDIKPGNILSTTSISTRHIVIKLGWRFRFVQNFGSRFTDFSHEQQCGNVDLQSPRILGQKAR